MHFTLSSLGSTLVLSSLCGATFAFPRLWGSRPESALEKRNVCIYDDYLLSLNAFLPDTEPFCSSYISIPLATITGSTTTGRTTTTEISTSEITGVTITTTDLVTETLTTTISAVGYKKRAPAPSPAARIEATVWLSKVARDAVADTSIAAALSSACSCLSVAPSTTTIIPAVFTTRTLSAIDYEYATAALTTTTTTIVTVVAVPTATAYSTGVFPVPNTNITSLLPLPPYPVNVTATSSSSESLVTPSALPAPFVPDGCPAINGTTLTAADGAVFLVLCDTDFAGRDSIGLSEPDLQSCVEECAQANDGFSANRCVGVSYRPQLANNCYLKTSVDTPTTNTTYEVVSAILITPLPLANTTTPLPLANTTTPLPLANTTTTTNTTFSTNSSGSISLPTFNTTALPIGPTATVPFNLTNITPSPAINVTTTPAPSSFPSLSLNDSRSEWSSVCSNCNNLYTSTIYSTTTVYVTLGAPSIPSIPSIPSVPSIPSISIF